MSEHTRPYLNKDQAMWMPLD